MESDKTSLKRQRSACSELRDALDDWKFANDKLLKVCGRIHPEATRLKGYSLFQALGTLVGQALQRAEKIV
jgi:hypothetical protein